MQQLILLVMPKFIFMVVLTEAITSNPFTFLLLKSNGEDEYGVINQPKCDDPNIPPSEQIDTLLYIARHIEICILKIINIVIIFRYVSILLHSQSKHSCKV